jgi:hypothetical protein
VSARHALATGASIVCAAVAFATPASAAVDAAGYTSKGQIVVRTMLGGAEITFGGDIALEERGDLLRFDLLSLAIPGTDPTLSAALSTQLFPQGGFTVVFDRSARTYTVWSPSKHKYYTGGPAQSNASPAPAPAPNAATAIGAAGDLFNAFAFAKSLKDDAAFNATLTLAGHGPVNGHPATGIDYEFSRTTKSGESTEFHGRLQLADDLDSVPVQITVSAHGKSLPQSSLRLDLTSLAKTPVPAGDFQVPAGYARVAEIAQVLGATLPGAATP